MEKDKTNHSKARYIKVSFWTDSYIEDLDPWERYLFLYLLTNPLCNIAGAYEIKTKRIAYETGMEKAKVEEILSKFENDEKVLYIDGWIILINWAKNQTKSISIEKGAQRIFENIPKNVISNEKFKKVIEAWHTVYPQWGEGVPTVYTLWGHTLPYLTLPNHIPNPTQPNPTLPHLTQPNAPAGTVSDEQVFNLMRKFKKLSPQLTGGEENQQEACLNLWREYGEETLAIVDQAILVQGQKYAPKILSPLDLWKKIGDLQVFLKRSQENINPNKVARVGKSV